MTYGSMASQRQQTNGMIEELELENREAFSKLDSLQLENRFLLQKLGMYMHS